MWYDIASEATEWIPNHNKMPVSAEATYAREICLCPKRRYLFFHYMGQTMLQRAGGWLVDPSFFNSFDLEWRSCHPGVALQAARRSPFPPMELDLWKWTRLHFPALLGQELANDSGVLGDYGSGSARGDLDGGHRLRQDTTTMSGRSNTGGASEAPAGPPFPFPVTALQRWAHLISNAVAGVLAANLHQGFEGRVLTHLPFTVGDIRNLSVTIGTMTAADHDHPNVLEYHTAPPSRNVTGEVSTRQGAQTTGSTAISFNTNASDHAPSSPTTRPGPKSTAKAKPTPLRKSVPYLRSLPVTYLYWQLLITMCLYFDIASESLIATCRPASLPMFRHRDVSKDHLTATWTTREYHYIHTPGAGKHDRLAGLLVMVSTRLAKADQLQYRVHHAGRLIHVRVPHQSIHVDVVNWYQYAINEQEGTPERRQQLLIKVQRCIAHLPKRNVLIFGGDFNCPCEPYKHVCGQVTVPFNKMHYMDLQDHQHVWRTLLLTALNTWQQPVHGQVATFAMGETETAVRSQIDFIMTRTQQVTARAKQASIIADFPVAAWRGGPRHYPVLAAVPIPRPHWNCKAPASSTPTPIDREQLIQDSRMDTPPARLLTMRAEISAQLHVPVDSYNTVLMQAAQKHYPLKKTFMQAPTQSTELANCAKTMWGLFRQMRAHRFTLPGIITAWRQWTQFQQAYRVHKERSKQRSKQRKLDLLHQAQQAADKGNVHELWKVIRSLAPKAPRKRLQLHKDGHLISPEAELDWILEAYGGRYAVDPEQAPIHFSFPAHQGLELNTEDLLFYLRKLNPRKAVPHGTAPAVIWQVCADLIAPPVISAFNTQQDGQPLVLQRWSDADVALLPKAHGRSDSPLDWRPIGVQDPLGKCLMSTIVAQARQAIHDLITQFPQCAYVKNRSTHTALRQVFSHCKSIRDRCSKARLTLHDQHEGQVRTKCCGGLQISLDLSAAFDLVEWSSIKQALDLARVNIAVQEVILTWLTQVRYIFRHRQLRGTIKPRRGLRQGCTASPVLWAAFTSLLCASIEDQLSPQWTREHLCLYADDSHLRFQFESFEEFTSIMNDVRVVFVCFRKFHLQINMAKTQAILKLVGTLKHRVHKEYVRKHQATKRLLLSPRDPERWLPLVPQAEYLGMIISYDHFEQQIYTVTFSEQTRHRNNLYEPQGMEELEEFFGGLPKQGVSRSLELPNKRRRPALGQPRDELPSHPSLLVSLAKQVVRQEEEIKLLKQDHALVFFLRPGENSMINHLFQTAKTFKAKQAANPQWAPGQQPLKVIMAIAIFKELGARLEALCQDQARLAQVKEYGWRDPATGWKYQRWNPQLKALEEDSSRGPISDQMVANHLQKLCQALAQDTVHRFHCTRRLADVV
ncbi:unnamed protein product, partial [Symbiodinium microadriaticum]